MVKKTGTLAGPFQMTGCPFELRTPSSASLFRRAEPLQNGNIVPAFPAGLQD